MLPYPTLIEQLASRCKLPEKKVRAVIAVLIEKSAEGLKAGKIVRIAGLGSLRVRDRKLVAAGQSIPTASASKQKRVVLVASKKFKAAADIDP